VLNPVRLFYNLQIDNVTGQHQKKQTEWNAEHYFCTFIQTDQLSPKITAPHATDMKIILGIDPGTIIMGYGLIAVKGQKLELIEMGVLKLASKTDAYQRLERIHDKVCSLIRLNKPHEFAIEAPFFGKNVQSMLKLGRAQGVAIAAAMQTGLPIAEYSPKKVKQSITGNGNAGKEQVMSMVQKLLKIKEEPAYLDATDAVAVAICHAFQISGPQTKSLLINKKGKSNNWEAFVQSNPGRVK
jgi:crossover junction endodeoxyribonuclease RuvC